MAVRAPAPINQNQLPYKLYVWMFIRGISHGFKWNTGLFGDGSEIQGYFVIFLDNFIQEQCDGDCDGDVCIVSGRVFACISTYAL